MPAQTLLALFLVGVTNLDSLYEQYIKERESLDVIKTERGFICYRLEQENCLINDYFVQKDFRKEGHGYFLANQVFEICKDAGVKTVFCSTDDRANGVELSKFTIENFGFELIDKVGPVSRYKMEVSEWEKFLAQ
jgi:GNAT superfamily N-acetyltransferase